MTAVEVVVGACTLFLGAVFGWPAWQNALHQYRSTRRTDEAAAERRELRDLAQAVAKVLTGTTDPAQVGEVTPENPSIRDLLNDVLGETAALTAELAILRHLFEHHISDGHGPPVPDYLRRRR